MESRRRHPIIGLKKDVSIGCDGHHYGDVPEMGLPSFQRRLEAIFRTSEATDLMPTPVFTGMTVLTVNDDSGASMQFAPTPVRSPGSLVVNRFGTGF
ncbi:hypothetical protein ACFL2Q_12860 [Thermodesulfobacteriota bacterium]